MNSVCHFSIKGKLAPRYISAYPIIDKYGPTSYKWNYRQSCREYIMCSMSPNTKDV
jgi:hypothetical protein